MEDCNESSPRNWQDDSAMVEAQIGTPATDVVRALEHHFDPHGIMNPGGTLGFDLPPELRRDLTNN
jgi:hypothetical protein